MGGKSNNKRERPLLKHWRDPGWRDATYVTIAVALVTFIAGVFVGIIGYALYINVTMGGPNDLLEISDAIGLEETTTIVPTDLPIPDPTLLSEIVLITPTTITNTATSTSLIALTPTPPPLFSEGPITYGMSFNGHPLRVYRLGTGPSARAIIGGIHGGYEWNTVELVSETLKHLQEHTDTIPITVTLYVIPCANPDGYIAGTDAIVARMNGNGVDLNRNWGYQWQMTATHGMRPVKAGAFAFSEPETDALRRFIEEKNIELAIFYHSAMGGVVFSGAEPEKSVTYELAEMLARATGYRHQTEGVPGQITTGDAIDWLSAKKGVAAAEIELTTHASVLNTPEWQQNWDGIVAFLRWSIPSINSLSSEDISMGDSWECITHTVQTGEVLSNIALEYGIDVNTTRYDALVVINDIHNPDDIDAGQILQIPMELKE